MCDDGCADNPCKNGGFCEELWGDKKFKCDCSFSEFAGPRCDTGKILRIYSYYSTMSEYIFISHIQVQELFVTLS